MKVTIIEGTAVEIKETAPVFAAQERQEVRQAINVVTDGQKLRKFISENLHLVEED